MIIAHSNNSIHPNSWSLFNFALIKSMAIIVCSGSMVRFQQFKINDSKYSTKYTVGTAIEKVTSWWQQMTTNNNWQNTFTSCCKFAIDNFWSTDISLCLDTSSVCQQFHLVNLKNQPSHPRSKLALLTLFPARTPNQKPVTLLFVLIPLLLLFPLLLAFTFTCKFLWGPSNF